MSEQFLRRLMLHAEGNKCACINCHELRQFRTNYLAKKVQVLEDQLNTIKAGQGEKKMHIPQLEGK